MVDPGTTGRRRRLRRTRLAHSRRRSRSTGAPVLSWSTPSCRCPRRWVRTYATDLVVGLVFDVGNNRATTPKGCRRWRQIDRNVAAHRSVYATRSFRREPHRSWSVLLADLRDGTVGERQPKVRSGSSVATSVNDTARREPAGAQGIDVRILGHGGNAHLVARIDSEVVVGGTGVIAGFASHCTMSNRSWLGPRHRESLRRNRWRGPSNTCA